MIHKLEVKRHCGVIRTLWNWIDLDGKNQVIEAKYKDTDFNIYRFIPDSIGLGFSAGFLHRAYVEVRRELDRGQDYIKREYDI